MFDTSVHGPLSVSASDRDWASELLSQVAGNDDHPLAVDPIAPFSRLEQQVLRLGLLEGEPPTARGAQPTRLSRAREWVVKVAFGDRGRNPLASPRLEALRRFSAATRHRRGGVDRNELSRFLKAGFSLQHALEIAICAVATSLGQADGAAIRTLRGDLDCGITRQKLLASGI